MSFCNEFSIVKGPFLGLKHFQAAENPFKMMKNAFYFHVLLKALFILLKIFKFLLTFGHLRKRLDKKAKGSFKIYDVTDGNK